MRFSELTKEVNLSKILAMTYMTLRHQRKDPDEDGSKPCNDFEHQQPFHIYQKGIAGNRILLIVKWGIKMIIFK